jgi:hypothetical protein
MVWEHASVWVASWLAVLLHYYNGLKSAGREPRTEYTQNLLLYHDYDLMDENKTMMNKYSELYANFCSLFSVQSWSM